MVWPVIFISKTTVTTALRCYTVISFCSDQDFVYLQTEEVCDGADVVREDELPEPYDLSSVAAALEVELSQ